MEKISYESTNRHRGSMPVHFLRFEKVELEQVVENSSDGLRINPNAYEGIAAQTGPKNQAQVHYVLLDGSVYRIFVGRTSTNRMEYSTIKSILRIGNVTEDSFAQLVPKNTGLSESQINRTIRKIIRGEQKQLKTSN